MGDGPSRRARRLGRRRGRASGARAGRGPTRRCSTRCAPLALLLLAGYLCATFAASDPDASWVAPLSLLPPLSPMMPMRVAADSVSAGEVLLALALTLACAVALIAFGARVYRTGITHRAGRASVYATRS